MPTLREKIRSNVLRGVSKSDIDALVLKLGLEEADMDLDIDVAKKRGAIRLENAAENVSLKKSADDLYSSVAGVPLPMVPTDPTSAAVPSEEVTPVVGAKRKPYREKVVVPLAQEFVGGIIPDPWQSSLPEFMQPESKENAANTTLQIGPSAEKFIKGGMGIVKEFGEMIGDSVYAGLDFSAEVASSLTGTPYRPVPRESESVTKQIIDEGEKQLAIAESVQADKPGYVRVGEFVVNVATQAKDITLGLAELVNYYGGINVVEGKEDDAEKRGAEVLGSLTGVSVSVITNLLNPTLWETRPLEALVTLVPIYKAILPVAAKSASLATKIPGAQRVVDAASVIMDNTIHAVKKSKVGTGTAAVVKGVKGGSAKATQLLTDGFSTGVASESAVVEGLFNESEALSSRIKEAGKRASERVVEADPTVMDQQTKPVSANDAIPFDLEAIKKDLEAIRKDPETIIRVSIDIGTDKVHNVDGAIKTKYLQEISVGTAKLEGKDVNMYRGKLTEAGEALVEGLNKDIKKANDKIVELENSLPKKMKNNLEELDDANTELLNNTLKIYQRMLAENVDAPKAALDAQFAEYFGGEGSYIVEGLAAEEAAAVSKNFSDLVHAKAVEQNLLQRRSAKLTDRVVAPAKTKEIYSIDETTGKVVRGTEVATRVLESAEESLGKRPTDEAAGYVKGEPVDRLYPDVDADLREFDRQALDQGKAKSVSVPAKGGTELGTRPYTTSDKLFDDAITEIADNISKVFPDDQVGAITPERIRSRFAVALNEAVLNNITLLRSLKVKKAILTFVEERLKDAGFTKDAIRRTLRDFEYDVLRPAVTENNTGKIRDFVLKDEVDTIVDGAMISNKIASLDPKILTEAKKQAVLDLTNDLAVEAKDAAMRKALQDETMRFMKDKEGNFNKDFTRNPEVFLISYIGRIFFGESPGVFMPFEGRKLAQIIRANVEIYVERILKTLEETDGPLDRKGKEAGDIRRVIENEAVRLEGMVEVDTSILEAKAATQLKGAAPKTDPHPNVFASPEVAAALNWEMAATEALNSPSFGLAIFSSAKRNLTARALTALKNNNLSNYYALTMKTGNPFAFVGVLADGFYNYLIADRSKLSPQKQRAFQAIDRSGIFDTTDLAKDIGPSTKATLQPILDRFFDAEKIREIQTGSLFKRSQAALSIWSTAMSHLENLYVKAGDIPFKVYEALNGYIELETALDKISVGNYVEGKISNNTKVRIVKGQNGALEVYILDNNNKVVPGKRAITGTLATPEISQLLGRISAFMANRQFFNYGDVGNWNKILKSYPVLNAISGFYTWYYKSLDIPGFKRGMVANTFFPAEFIKTNDPVLIRQNINKAIGQATRRALVVNLALGNVDRMSGETDKEKEAIDSAKKAIAFNPKDSAGILLGPLGDPSNLYYNDFSNQTPFKATDLLLKMGASVLASAAGFGSPKDVEDRLFPLYKTYKDKNMNKAAVEKDRKALGFFLKDLRGESWTSKDVLSLVGLGGSAIFSVLEEIADSEQQGKVLDVNKAINNFANVFIGRTPWALITNTIGGAGMLVDPAKDPSNQSFLESAGEKARSFSPYSKERKKHGFLSGNVAPDSQKFSMYLLAQVIGAGWKKVNLLDEKENIVTGSVLKSRYEYYLTGVSKELKANVVNRLEDKARQYKALADNTEDPALKEKYEAGFKYYSKNVEMVKEQIEDILEDQRDLMFRFFNNKK